MAIVTCKELCTGENQAKLWLNLRCQYTVQYCAKVMQTKSVNFIPCFPNFLRNFHSLIWDDMSLEQRPIIQRIVVVVICDTMSDNYFARTIQQIFVSTTTICNALSDISLEQRPIIKQIVVSKQHQYKGKHFNPHFKCIERPRMTAIKNSRLKIITLTGLFLIWNLNQKPWI